MNVNVLNKNRVSNSQEIRELARDVVRMSGAEHPMLNDTYSRFVDAGIESPSFAQVMLKQAEMDYYTQYAKNLVEGTFVKNEFKNKIYKVRENLNGLENTFMGKMLVQAIKKDFPQTGLKRLAILSSWVENSNELKPCSLNKRFKKFTYKCLKRINNL